MRIVLMLAAAAAVTGCSAQNGPSGSQTTAESAMAPATADAAARSKGGDGPAPVEVALPQLAYSYKLGFLLDGGKIAEAQEAHRALCERLGPARCQLLALSRGQAEDAEGSALLKLRVASAEARSFSDALGKAVSQAGGRTIGTQVSAEDVSKNIVDAEARIRQRELLVTRLTEILHTRTGKVAELVEAERSVAQAQEELDQAKGWLAELRGRVAMSDFEINYSAVAPSASPGSTGSQLADAIVGSGASFLIGIRGLLTLFIYLLPWLLILVPAVLLVRAGRRRWRRRPVEAVAAQAPPPDEG
jgi:hypothetical protein